MNLAIALWLAASAVASCPGYTPEDLSKMLRSAGDVVSAPITLPGQTRDSIVVDIDKRGIWLWAFKDNCLGARPILFDSSYVLPDASA